jgi:hypothetical protein
MAGIRVSIWRLHRFLLVAHHVRYGSKADVSRFGELVRLVPIADIRG